MLASKREYTQAYKAGKRAISQALRSGALDAARDAFDTMARKLVALGDALDGVSVQRADEKRKIKFLQGQLRWLKRLMTPGYLERLAAPGDVNDATVSVAMESVDEVVPSVLRLYDRIVSYREVEQSFAHGPFTVHNLYGYKPEEYESALSLLDQAADKIKAAGFGDVIYGDVRLVGDSPSTGFCGRYRPATDTISLNVECRNRFNDLYTLVHEIGHRHWFQKLSAAERDAYEDAYAGTTDALTVAEREDMWQAWKRAGYTLRGVGRYLKDPSLLDQMRRYVKERRKGVMLVPDERLGWPEDKARNLFVSPRVRYWALDDAPPSSVTDYGSSDVKEDYAEVFAHHVLGKRIAPDAQARFDAAIGKPSAARVASWWLQGSALQAGGRS